MIEIGDTEDLGKIPWHYFRSTLGCSHWWNLFTQNDVKGASLMLQRHILLFSTKLV